MTLERLRVNTITLKWKLPLLRYSRLARASTHEPPQSPSLPRPFSHLNYPAPTYIHPVPAAGSACLALVGTTLTLVLPTYHRCPLGSLRLWKQHCLGIKVTCWAISISPISLASPHKPGLWSTLPWSRKYKFLSHTLCTSCVPTPWMFSTQLGRFLASWTLSGCSHWPLSPLGAL